MCRSTFQRMVAGLYHFVFMSVSSFLLAIFRDEKTMKRQKKKSSREKKEEKKRKKNATRKTH